MAFLLRTVGLTILCSFGWVLPVSAANNAPLGSAANPVRADSFLGEMEYLARLRCRDGTRPHAQRLTPRSRREGPYGNRLIGYRVRCIYLNSETTVYIDELHRQYVELEPVPGFTLAGPPDQRRLFWFDR